MRILVVENDRKVASFIRKELSEEGHAVDALSEGPGDAARAGLWDYDAVREFGLSLIRTVGYVRTDAA